MKTEFNLLLNLTFSEPNIRIMLQQFINSGYTFSIRAENRLNSKMRPIGLQAAIDLVMNGHTVGSSFSSEIRANPMFADHYLSLYIDSDKGFVSLSHLYEYYDWPKASRYFRDIFKILRPFRINKIKAGLEEHDFFEQIHEVPVINTDWTWDDDDLFYDNAIKAGYSIIDATTSAELTASTLKDTLMAEKTVLLTKNQTAFRVLHMNRPGYLYFLPQSPYITCAYSDGVGLDLSHYFEAVLDFCEGTFLVFVIETSGFDD